MVTALVCKAIVLTDPILPQSRTIKHGIGFGEFFRSVGTYRYSLLFSGYIGLSYVRKTDKMGHYRSEK